jgi:hypothetical protein
VISDTIGSEQVDIHLIPSLQEIAKDKQWRVRLQTMQYFPKLAQFINKDIFIEKLEPILHDWMIDSVYTIREVSITTL